MVCIIYSLSLDIDYIRIMKYALEVIQHLYCYFYHVTI